ncbi:MAG TPA: LysR substrate-binding domain-containing protein [Streptosporangiaceae bacterium]|nr:LysR substrate-binding domain-containing protein [Streptosporangiaceae bacterium]
MTSPSISGPATIHSDGFPSLGVDHPPAAAPMAKARQTTPSRAAFEGEEVETLRALVAAGLGVALLPPPRTPPSTPASTEAPPSHLHITDADCTRDIGLAWLAERPLPAASASFRQHVLQSAPAVTPPKVSIRFARVRGGSATMLGVCCRCSSVGRAAVL